MDPRYLIARVEVLLDLLERAAMHAGATLEGAEYSLRQCVEMGRRGEVLAATLAQQALEEQESVERIAAQLDGWVHRSRDARDTAWAIREEAVATLGHANSEMERWQKNLAEAEAWRERAKRWEANAERALSASQSSLSAARMELGNAEAALSAAQSRTEYAGTDKDGKTVYRRVDTSSYQAAVAGARSRVMSAESAVQTAAAELGRASADHRAAEARSEECHKLQSWAEQAVQTAGEAVEHCSNALATAERGIEECSRAQRLSADVTKRAKLGVERAESLQAVTRLAREDNDRAGAALRTAEEYTTEAKRTAVEAVWEIKARLDQLRAFEEPRTELTS